MTKPILLAGVLGGLLGGVCSFAVGRLTKTPPPEKPNLTLGTIAVPPDARNKTETYVDKIRQMKYDEFVNDLKTGMIFMSDKEFADFKQSFEVFRTVVHGVYGTPTGEVTLLHETALTQDLVRFVYLQQFPRGAIVWTFVLYRSKDGWGLNRVLWNRDLLLAFPGSS
jgi:hypothetical protein